MRNQTVRIWAAGMHVMLLTFLLIFVLSSCDDDDEPGQLTPLSIESITTTARVGETIIITGTGFMARPSRNDIKFSGRASGSVDGQVLAASTTSLTVKVPADAEDGPITVTVQGVTITSTQHFILDTSLGAPTLASITPGTGFVNTEVTITGTNFGTDKNVIKVLFGILEVTDILALTDKTVKIKAPVSLPTGEVEVKVEREGKRSAESVTFTVKPPPPIVTTLYYGNASDLMKTVIDNQGIHTDLVHHSDVGSMFCLATDFDRGYAYWGVSGKIFRTSLSNGETDDLYVDEYLLNTLMDITIDFTTGVMYISSIGGFFEHGYILKGSLDGTAPLTVILDESFENTAGNMKLSVSTNALVWVEPISNRIRSASLSGAFNPITLFEHLSAASGVAIDEVAGKLYITDNGGTGGAAILTGNLDGTGNLTTLIAGGDLLKTTSDAEIDTVNGYFYWVDNFDIGSSNINRVKLDGTGMEVLVEGFGSGQALAIDTR